MQFSIVLSGTGHLLGEADYKVKVGFGYRLSKRPTFRLGYVTATRKVVLWAWEL
jgi:hypothetical protein